MKGDACSAEPNREETIEKTKRNNSQHISELNLKRTNSEENLTENNAFLNA